MSNLIKPYVISVWDDVWVEAESCFKEFRLGIIGTDTMTYQGRALTPELTRNVNGTKKLTFKMYKQFVDTVTGEKVSNPYVDLLINERKVKLEYDGKWFDFIVKNISEKSSDHSITYQLEDANVAELSKNGFNVTLDSELMNNSGTITGLAQQVLAETDWTVSTDSDEFSQTIEEALVYLKTDGEINAIQIIDAAGTVDQQLATIPDNSIVLGFYSSCVGKPHRFQFIYLPSYEREDVFGNGRKDDRVIEQKNCQYYIQFDNENVYEEVTDTLVMNLPTGFTPYHPGAVFGEEKDSILSAWYRGRRYNFSQESIYVPLLERYVNVYLSENGERYYGYADTTYASPALVQNIVTNSKFASTSGWTGTHDNSDNSEDSSIDKGIVDNVYGRFEEGRFVSSTEDLGKGDFDDYISQYKPYLKISLPNEDACVINSGPRDNRISIGNMEVGSEWYLKCVAHDGSPDVSYITAFELGEFVYSPGSQGYVAPTAQNIKFDKKVSENKEYIIFKVIDTNYTEATFKKNSQIRLKYCPREKSEVYIESIELFRVIRDENGDIIHPLEQTEGLEALENRVTKTQYKYFKADSIENVATAEDIPNVTVLPKQDNIRFKPIYNEKAEKIRTVSAKESNYFNILQTIAETFEAWLDLRITRDKFGGITAKEVVFKKYAGRNNLAGFRYGVNLKDIQRTYASKDIVTKLIVKDNSNQFAKNGFCTVARASANPIGETCLYDFQYYYNTGLLDPKIHLNVLYYMAGAKGQDINSNDTEWNIIGYYPRLGMINTKIDKCNDKLIGLSTDLTRLKAQREVAQTQYDAAISGCEEAASNFEYLSAGQEVTEWHAEADEPRKDLVRAQRAYIEYLRQKLEAEKDLSRLNALIDSDSGARTEYNNLVREVEALIKYKATLNRLFYKLYSRFIQEGTWLSEEYVDDELYYADAQSVLYNSCYPTVAYTIDVIAVDAMPDYGLYKFGLGDTTYVEDGEFFGYNEDKTPKRTEVVITETVEQLEEPDKNKIKVQNFKNQFQDLFQKITATVQQTKYSTGAYEKAVALAEANAEKKKAFLNDALSAATAKIQAAGQQSVTWGNDGVNVVDTASPCDAVKIIGGALAVSHQNENGEQEWAAAFTSKGISANLITAGILNVGELAIMNADEPLFKWDAFGISAFDTIVYDGDVTGADLDKFVRFDKHGLYGVKGRDGATWRPANQEELMKTANFALTWDGLKVQGDEGAVVRIGKTADNLIDVTKGEKSVFSVSTDGAVSMEGNVVASGGQIAGWGIDDEYGIHSDEHTVAMVNPSTAAEGLHKNSLKPNATKPVPLSFYAGSSDPDTSDPSEIPEFAVLADGSVYASNAKIAGTVEAKNGSIGGWEIEDNQLYTQSNWTSIREDLLEVYFDSFSDRNRYHDTTGSNTYGYRLVGTDSMGLTRGQKYRIVCEPGHFFRVKIAKAQGAAYNRQWVLYDYEAFEDTFTMPTSGNYYLYLWTSDSVAVAGASVPEGLKITSLVTAGEIEGGIAEFRIGLPTNNTSENSAIVKLGDFEVKKSGATYIKEAHLTQDIYFDNTNESTSRAVGKQQMGWRAYSSSQEKRSEITADFSQVETKGILTIRVSALWDSLDILYSYMDGNGNWSANDNIVGFDVGDFGIGRSAYAEIEVEKDTQSILFSLDTEGPYMYPLIVSSQVEEVSRGFVMGGSVIPYFTEYDNGENIIRHAKPLSLGDNNLRWEQVYAKEVYNSDGLISNSDLRKKSVVEFKPEYDTFFDSLNPIVYQRTDGTYGRIHCGFGAQDVEAALAQSGLTNMDFAGLCKWGRTGAEDYGLRYEEFVALNTRQIQQLKSRIHELESELDLIKKEIAELKNK